VEFDLSQIAIAPEGPFSLGGENFVLEGRVSPKERRSSCSESFKIVKMEPYLRFHEGLAPSFSPRSILELGIFREELRVLGQAI